MKRVCNLSGVGEKGGGGVLPIMACMGRLFLKGVPFSGLSHVRERMEISHLYERVVIYHLGIQKTTIEF